MPEKYVLNTAATAAARGSPAARPPMLINPALAGLAGVPAAVPVGVLADADGCDAACTPATAMTATTARPVSMANARAAGLPEGREPAGRGVGACGALHGTAGTGTDTRWGGVVGWVQVGGWLHGVGWRTVVEAVSRGQFHLLGGGRWDG